MKRTITLTAAFAGGLLLGALTLPALGQVREQRARHASGPEEASWFAPGPGGPGGGPGAHPHRPGRQGGPEGAGGPGFDGPLARMARVMIPFWQNEELAAELNLDQSQVDQLEKSHAATKEGLEATDGSIEEAGKALKAAMEQDNPDAAAVNAAVDRLTQAMNEKAKIILGHGVVVKTVLTEEQEAALKEAGPKYGREHAEKFRGVVDEIRDTVANGGTLDDVKAIIEQSDLPPGAKKLGVRMAERRWQQATGKK